MGNSKQTWVVMVKRAEFYYDNGRFVTIEVSSGAIEIYKVDPVDGIEMFQGYITDLNIPGSLRARATNALYNDSQIGVTFSRPVQLDLNLSVDA